jgi:hypothetical protein
MIEDWPTPELVRDVEVLLELPQFYERFNWKYSLLSASTSNLLKTQRSHKWHWTRDAELAFPQPNMAITKAPIIQNCNPQKLIIVQADAGVVEITAMPNHYDKLGILRPVNLYCVKCCTGKHNYDTYDRELLTIVEKMKQWRHYFEGANHNVLIQRDNNQLELL